MIEKPKRETKIDCDVCVFEEACRFHDAECVFDNINIMHDQWQAYHDAVLEEIEKEVMFIHCGCLGKGKLDVISKHKTELTSQATSQASSSEEG